MDSTAVQRDLLGQVELRLDRGSSIATRMPPTDRHLSVAGHSTDVAAGIDFTNLVEVDEEEVVGTIKSQRCWPAQGSFGGWPAITEITLIPLARDDSQVAGGIHFEDVKAVGGLDIQAAPPGLG